MDEEKNFDRPGEWNVRNIRQDNGLTAEFTALIIERSKQGLGPLTLKDGEERLRFMRWAQEDGWGVSESRMDKNGKVQFIADYDSSGKLIQDAKKQTE